MEGWESWKGYRSENIGRVRGQMGLGDLGKGKGI